ncbi:right-handed parallel beta-helix repeat-containing protein [Pelagicoccus mobilis]|uniref:Right-handed parallel beta-helix repeat-containing protein n=1 Tax=Pelagicoccus mobilis TaxID=415221 RepID=A0A934VNA9_9BACT|nr:right-handed parallel beta-helix repeat-containing protein [Pelagicoccus mobilis]MBK1876037.1 right-handed parallel beta-helix repeat-containing protein [Pelagicoccus mobilis]
MSSTLAHGMELYVSPSADAPGDGSKRNPYSSVAEARDHIRDLDSEERLQDITVFLRGGTYALDETIVFDLRDSAPDGYQYSYVAYRKEVPVFSSGVAVEDWTVAKEFPENFPDEAKGKVYVADFPESVDAFYTLFKGYERIARSKKEGFEIRPLKPLHPVKDAGKKLDRSQEYIAARSMNVYHNEDRGQLTKFYFDDPDGILKEWERIQGIEIGFAPVPWGMNIVPLESVDRSGNVAYLEIEANAPPGAKLSHTKPWVENAIDYISEGTFVTLNAERKIYYWPKDGKRPEGVVAPQLLELVKVEGDINYNRPTDVPVKNLVFKGITFMHADRYAWDGDHKGWGIQHDWDKFDEANAMLRFRGAEDCEVIECRFTNSGNSAIRLDLHCQGIRIEKNLIDYVGHMGILLCGYGPGTKDVNKRNVITNNLIHRVGRVIKHGAGVFVWQSGENVISHNLIHNVPRKGIGLCGVRLPILTKDWCDFDEASKTIRWDEIREDLAKRFDSPPASFDEEWKRKTPYLHARKNIVEYNEVYRALEELGDGSVLNVSGAGDYNVVRNNYVHRIASHASGVLRTDDWQQHTTFTGNIIYKANISGIVHKGYNHIENNKIIDCSVMEFIRFASYPDEANNTGSRIRNNIFYESGDKVNLYRESYRASEGISLPHNCDTDYNLMWCAGKPEVVEDHLKVWRRKGVEKNSLAEDPLFVGMEDEGFRLDKASPAFDLGFEEIDFERIGLTDAYPKRYLELDVPDDGSDEDFHRNRGKKVSIYDFW